MRVNDILRLLLKEKAVSYSEAAYALGYSSEKSVASVLSYEKMSLSTVQRFADFLGYDIVLCPRKSGKGKKSYIVD